MAFRELIQGEGKLMGLLSINVSLEGVHKIMDAVQPTLSVILIITQLAVAGITLRHLILKMLGRHRDKKATESNEETES